jgi:hypothetical protein
MYRVKYYNDYVTSIWLSTESRNTGDTTYEVELDEAYPTSIGPVEMSAGSDGEIATFTVTFTMRDWHAVTNDNVINPDAYKKSNEGEREAQEYLEWKNLEVKWDKERAEDMEMEKIFDAADWENDKHDIAIAQMYQDQAIKDFMYGNSKSKNYEDLTVVAMDKADNRHFSDIIKPGDVYVDMNGQYQIYKDRKNYTYQDLNYNAMLEAQRQYQIAKKQGEHRDASDAFKAMGNIQVANARKVEYKSEDFNERKKGKFRMTTKKSQRWDRDKAVIIAMEAKYGKEALQTEFPPGPRFITMFGEQMQVEGDYIWPDGTAYNRSIVTAGENEMKESAMDTNILLAPSREITTDVAVPIEAYKIDLEKKRSHDAAAFDVDYNNAVELNTKQDDEIAIELKADAEFAVRAAELENMKNAQIMAHGFKSGDAQNMAQGFKEADARQMAQEFISIDLQAKKISDQMDAQFQYTPMVEEIKPEVIINSNAQKIVDLKAELEPIDRYFNKGDKDKHEWDAIWEVQMSDKGEFIQPDQDILDASGEYTGQTTYDVFLDHIYDRRKEIKKTINEMESETTAPFTDTTQTGGNTKEFTGGFPAQGEMFYKDTQTDEYYMTQDNEVSRK